MKKLALYISKYPVLIFSVLFLILLSVFTLNSISQNIFPQYYIYIILAFVFFIIFLNLDFSILQLFSVHLYILSIALLILPLIIGQITRGAIRWIPIGSLTLQPSEIVRPFLLIFLAEFLMKKGFNTKRLIYAFILILIPVFLILIQPSLGVAILTMIGFTGVFLASGINKRYIFISILLVFLLAPLLWLVLAPYQKARIVSFANPGSDPYGSGYNSIQAMISVGSGQLFGRGLGRGVQTQLRFLPEKHSDFIFAAIAEELGFFGSLLVIFAILSILMGIVKITENSINPSARAFTTGVFFVLFCESVIHIGMNMGIVPITGVPLPFVSAGGSSLLASSIMLAISLNSAKLS